MMDYDALMQILRSRRSVRRFTSRPVEREVITKLVDAARWAPSNHNRQAWRFVVIDDRATLTQLAEACRVELAERLAALPALAAEYSQSLLDHAVFFEHAPCLIFALHKRSMAVSAAMLQGLEEPALVSGEPISTALAVENLLLAAHALGLGACVMTAPLLAQRAITQLLALPRGYHPTCCIALGYPSEMPATPERKPVESILEFR